MGHCHWDVQQTQQKKASWSVQQLDDLGKSAHADKLSMCAHTIQTQITIINTQKLLKY
jgi:hypothetical protein